MTNFASQTAPLSANSPRPIGVQTVITVLGVWLAAVMALGASGVFIGAPGRPPLSVFGAAVTPLILFAVAMRVSQAFREFVLALDVRLIVGIQGWRYAGFGFIALYTNHILPGLFAWPAALGDMAIGIAAPLWIVALIQKPEVVASPQFKLWNALGILDFVIAFTTATICAMMITDPAMPSMGAMGRLPLILIPAFMVPLFVMLHSVALMHSKQARPS